RGSGLRYGTSTDRRRSRNAGSTLLQPGRGHRGRVAPGQRGPVGGDSRARGHRGGGELRPGPCPLLEIFEPWMRPPPKAAVIGGFGGAFGGFGGGLLADRWFAMVVQCLWTLLIASMGGILARFFFASSRDQTDEPRPDAPATGDLPRSRW